KQELPQVSLHIVVHLHLSSSLRQKGPTRAGKMNQLSGNS
ncbi:unnamed protein product, partial [Caretta caretta]